MSIVMLFAQHQGLDTSGWIMLMGSIGLVCGMCAFCFWRIVREEKPNEYHHVPSDTDTREMES